MFDVEATDVANALEAARSSNAKALTTVYQQDRHRMTGLAARLLREHDVPGAVVDAEDLVQTAFEKALRARHLLTEPRAYVYAILRRDVSHWAARLHREREAERLAELRTSLPHRRDIAAAVTDRVIVQQGLRQLPRQQATALVATKMYGFTQRETAQSTGRHLGTIAVHTARAVAAMTLYFGPALLIGLAIWLDNGWSPYLLAGGCVLGSATWTPSPTLNSMSPLFPLALPLNALIEGAVKLCQNVQRIRGKPGARH